MGDVVPLNTKPIARITQPNGSILEVRANDLIWIDDRGWAHVHRQSAAEQRAQKRSDDATMAAGKFGAHFAAWIVVVAIIAVLFLVFPP